MLLSVIVTTKNEEANIGTCLASLAHFAKDVETVVVDNFSADSTCDTARRMGARVISRGPERCAQRNAGWRAASADWILVLDADMVLPAPCMEEILAKISNPQTPPVDAYWIPEVRSGEGWRTRVRNFERSFYDGTCIDALRLFRRSILEKTGGWDESLAAGGEDWELDIRVLGANARCEILSNHLVHNEKKLSYSRMLEKKAYYSRGLELYKAKWPDHPSVKKQFSPWYRFFGVFIENGKWRKVLRHPILFAGVMFERFSVGVVYLKNRKA